jgi:hypothetical protein
MNRNTKQVYKISMTGDYIIKGNSFDKKYKQLSNIKKPKTSLRV